MIVADEFENSNGSCPGGTMQRLSALYRSKTPTQDAARSERSTVQLPTARRYKSWQNYTVRENIAT
jgi:hypothetical protein